MAPPTPRLGEALSAAFATRGVHLAADEAAALTVALLAMVNADQLVPCSDTVRDGLLREIAPLPFDGNIDQRSKGAA